MAHIKGFGCDEFDLNIPVVLLRAIEASKNGRTVEFSGTITGGKIHFEEVMISAPLIDVTGFGDTYRQYAVAAPIEEMIKESKEVDVWAKPDELSDGEYFDYDD